MAREQKTRAKASQKAKPHVATTQVQGQTGASPVPTTTFPDETQTTKKTTNAHDTNISAQQEQTAVEQSTTSSKQVVWSGWQPSWPSWPTSKPGPRSTPPIAGTRPINTFRPEQFKETDYNQQIGKPAMQRSPDGPTFKSDISGQLTAQNAPGKGKQRL
jgi:hypothetical protein